MRTELFKDRNVRVNISPLYCPCYMGKLGKSAVKSQQQIDFVSKNWFYEQFRTNRCGPPRWDLKPNGMKSCAKELKQNNGVGMEEYALNIVKWLQRRGKEAEIKDPMLRQMKDRINELAVQFFPEIMVHPD